MTDTTPLSATRFLGPRYWLNWIGVGLLWSVTRLPYKWQLAVGRVLGKFMHSFARVKGRGDTVRTNLRLCFPELSEREREELVKKHYESLGVGVIEVAMSWWTSDEKLAPLVAEIEGLEHLRNALKQGKGVILMGAHFTTLEIGARLLNMHVPFYVVYKHFKNPLFDAVMRRAREKHVKKAIHRNDIRTMVKSLKENMPVWYATDMNYRGKYAVFVPFFGVLASTNPATSRLARSSGAPVIPFFQERLPNGRGYRLVVNPPVADFPSDSVERDTQRLNEVIEAHVRRVPEQYFWVHRRFRTRPPGEGNLY